MTSRTLTLATLTDLGPCSSQTDLFRQTFGESVEVTEALCASVADRFEWGWAAVNLLSPAAWAAYESATAPARAAYESATAPALAAYRSAAATAFAQVYVNDTA